MNAPVTLSMETRALSPFGIEVRFAEGTRLTDVDANVIHAWAREHLVVVLRGLAPLTKLQLPNAARALGPLQAWEFGSIHELVVKEDAKNYLYTNHVVPLHWDGAFVQRAPHYLVFQCNSASPGGAGGSTTFVDTTRVWAKADQATRDKWRALTFEYSTDKVAHYGGSFRARLVAQHEANEGETVLRFAEPVDDLNPVHVECVGVSPLESAALIGELRTALYANDVRYEHEWQPGDLVIADNLALLHGRRAFHSESLAPPHVEPQGLSLGEREPEPAWGGRRIWRVNVHRKKERTIADALRDSIRIRRPEFMVAEIPIFLVPFVLVGGQNASPYLVWPLVAVVALLFHFGDMVNCYADRDLDAVFKTRQSEAIYGLGLRNVRWQMIVTVTLALLLAAQLSLSLDRVEPIALVVGGLVWGAQYSLRPLWLKSRGILATVTLCAIIFVGPMVLVAGTLGAMTTTLFALFCAYAVMQMGIILVNTAEDIPEDTDAGIRTAAVALGLVPTLRLATAMTMVGGAGVIALLTWTGGLEWTLLPLVAALAYAALGVASTLRDTRITELRKRSRWMPAWIAATAWATLIGAWGASLYSGSANR